MSNSNEKRKGERPDTIRVPAIRMYPAKDASKETDKEEVEYQTYHTYRNPNGDPKDKTNLNAVKVPKVLRIYGNAEDYCRLRARLERDVWGQMRPETCGFFVKMTDFRNALEPDCTEMKCAEDRFVLALYERMRKFNIPKGTSIENILATRLPDSGRLDALNRYFNEHKAQQSFVLNILYPPSDRMINSESVDAWAMMEREFWEHFVREIFPHPGQCFDTQVEYLRYDARKPLSESFAAYKARIEEIFSMLKYFPARAKKNCFPTAKSMDTRSRTVKEDVIRRAIYDGLPRSWQEEFRKRIQEDLLDMTAEQFKTFFTKIEEEDRDNQSKKPKGKDSKEDSKTKPKGGDEKKSGGDGSQKKKSGNKFCSKCKRLGRSEAAYKSHNTNDCTWKTKESNESFKSDKKKTSSDFKSMKKEFKRMQKQLAKMEKAKGSGKKRKRDDSSSSDSSDSDYD